MNVAARLQQLLADDTAESRQKIWESMQRVHKARDKSGETLEQKLDRIKQDLEFQPHYEIEYYQGGVWRIMHTTHSQRSGKQKPSMYAKLNKAKDFAKQYGERNKISVRVVEINPHKIPATRKVIKTYATK